MAFYDLDNMLKSLWRRDSSKKYDVGKVQFLLIELLEGLMKHKCKNEDLIRVYAYTGEYHPKIINRIDTDLKYAKIESDKERLTKLKEKSLRGYNSQKGFFWRARRFNFFELRTCPLQYAKKSVFQKGVDVQMAVDLVSSAYKDNFDIAVVATGDIDLLESLKIVKSLGKKVVLFSHRDLTARDMRKEADYFIDIASLSNESIGKVAMPNR